jgi:hypothetical protein
MTDSEAKICVRNWHYERTGQLLDTSRMAVSRDEAGRVLVEAGLLEITAHPFAEFLITASRPPAPGLPVWVVDSTQKVIKLDPGSL